MIDGEGGRNSRNSSSDRGIWQTTSNGGGVVHWWLCISDISMVEMNGSWVEEDDDNQQNLKDARRKYSNGNNSHVECR